VRSVEVRIGLLSTAVAGVGSRGALLARRFAVRMEALMGAQGGAYVDGFAIQVGSIWMDISILVVVVFGLWKLAKIVWAAFSN